MPGGWTQTSRPESPRRAGSDSLGIQAKPVTVNFGDERVLLHDPEAPKCLLKRLERRYGGRVVNRTRLHRRIEGQNPVQHHVAQGEWGPVVPLDLIEQVALEVDDGFRACGEALRVLLAHREETLRLRVPGDERILRHPD